MDVYELTGEQAENLRLALQAMTAEPWRTLKVAIDIDGFKFKVGEGMWSPGYGQKR